MPGNGTVVEGAKAVADALLAQQRSVVDLPDVNKEGPWVGSSQGPDPIMWYVARAADEITPWGTNTTLRDTQLRLFVPTESVLCSAIASIAARNAGYTWVVDGPPSTTERAHDMLTNANNGRGWVDYIVRFCLDLYQQDKGAFIETIREGDSAEAPVVALQNLDAARCWHTGDPMNPVIYIDRRGKYHQLKWYQVRTVAEMPTPHERLYGIQMCAVTRVLNLAQRFRDTSTYLSEKTSGRNTRAVHIVSGVQQAALAAAIEQTKAEADNRQQTRFMQPVILTTLSPEAKASVATLEMASVPDGFNEAEFLKTYLTILALGTFTDFQEFAPLPGGGLGTSMQSEILHLKGQGKGPQMFRKLVEHVMNTSGILPRNCTFRFDEQDIGAEDSEAKVKLSRAQRLDVMVKNQTIDPAASRQIALDEGDIPQEVFDRLDQAEMLGDVTGPAPVAQVDTTNVAPELGKPLSPAAAAANVPQAEAQPALKEASEDRAGPEPERLAFEGEVTAAIESAFAKARTTVMRVLGSG